MLTDEPVVNEPVVNEPVVDEPVADDPEGLWDHLEPLTDEARKFSSPDRSPPMGEALPAPTPYERLTSTDADSAVHLEQDWGSLPESSSEFAIQHESGDVANVPLNQSADLNSMIDVLESDLDEFVQLEGPSDSLMFPHQANSTTRSFIDESRLLEKLEALHQDVPLSEQPDPPAEPSEDSWNPDELSRTMVANDLPVQSWEGNSDENWPEPDASPNSEERVDEEQEFHAPSPAPPVSAASILESMGVLPDDYEAEASAAPVAAAADTPHRSPEPEVDLSIQEYMDQLLQRLGSGGTSTSHPAPASSAPDLSRTYPVHNTAPRTRSRSAPIVKIALVEHDDAEATEEDQQTFREEATTTGEETPAVSRPTASDEDFISLGETLSTVRSRVITSSSVKSDLSAMLELANTSAQTAIDQHIRKRWGYAAAGKVTVCIAALVTGIGLSQVAKGWASISFWGAALLFVISAFWAVQSFQIGRLVLAAYAAAKADANETR